MKGGFGRIFIWGDDYSRLTFLEGGNLIRFSGEQVGFREENFRVFHLFQTEGAFFPRGFRIFEGGTLKRDDLYNFFVVFFLVLQG